jgi:membrane dipeptidase
MSDDMIRKLAGNGGVIQIAFGSSFVSDGYRREQARRTETIDRYLREQGLTRDHPRAPQEILRFEQENPLLRATVSQVADHIDHVRNLVGIDHVGFGSDFDGVGDTTPTGLRDVSEYPNLLAELVDRGYTEEEIEKICSGNLLRVWTEVERVAAELQAES